MGPSTRSTVRTSPSPNRCAPLSGLDRVLLVVANEPWQKEDGPVAPAEDRYAMVAAAAKDWPGLEPSRIEIDRGGPSYTIDTVRELKGRDPDVELALIVGSDVAAQLGSWKDEAALREMVTRGGGRPAGRPIPGARGLEGGRRTGRALRRLEHRAPSATRCRSARTRPGSRCRDPLHRAARSVRYEEMIVGMRPPASGSATPASDPDPAEAVTVRAGAQPAGH